MIEIAANGQKHLARPYTAKLMLEIVILLAFIRSCMAAFSLTVRELSYFVLFGTLITFVSMFYLCIMRNHKYPLNYLLKHESLWEGKLLWYTT